MKFCLSGPRSHPGTLMTFSCHVTLLSSKLEQFYDFPLFFYVFHQFLKSLFLKSGCFLMTRLRSCSLGRNTTGAVFFSYIISGVRDINPSHLWLTLNLTIWPYWCLADLLIIMSTFSFVIHKYFAGKYSEYTIFWPKQHPRSTWINRCCDS